MADISAGPSGGAVSKTTPKDFFLWLGAIIALYGSVSSFIALVFQYVNYAFPDPLAYAGDPYGSAIRVSMAALIVLTPTALLLFHLIRRSIELEPGKADIWVRRWALVLTLFIAGATAAIDLITLVNTFLEGEITIRFGLKVAVVLLAAVGVFLHFLADLKGYWTQERVRADIVAAAVGFLAIVTLVCGFLIIGTPGSARLIRFDEQKVSDLQNIQYQVVNYWQQQEKLPASLEDLADPISGYALPHDPQAGHAYTYKVTGPLSFSLCADFNKPTPDTAGKGGYGGDYAAPIATRSYPGYAGTDDNWQHGEGNVCFTRTIDPKRNPPYKTLPVPAAKGL